MSGIPPVPVTVAQLLELLAVPMRHASEAQLQAAIQRVLDDARLTYYREAKLSGPDRVDFLVSLGVHDDRVGVAVEVKVKGGASEVERQLARYAAHDLVDVVVLVSTRVLHARMPRELHGKRVHTVIKADAGLM